MKTQEILNEYKELDTKYNCNGELLKFIEYLVKRKWIHNIQRVKNDIYLKTEKFYIAVCFDGGYSECEGFVKIYADLKNHFDKLKYCAIQAIIYSNNVDTLISMLERLENNIDYFHSCNNRETPFEYGYFCKPDPKFKQPKGLKY